MEDQYIFDLIDSGCPYWVEKARKDHKVLNVHVNGVGKTEYLARIDGLENATQYKLRKKHARDTVAETSNILRPIDKCFSAKGGSTNIDFSGDDKDLANRLSEFSDGMNVKEWIKNVYTNKYYSDPNGLLFFEWDEENVYPTLYSIEEIENYDSGGRDVNWVLFAPYKKESDPNCLYYRFVDDERDITIKVSQGGNKTFTIVEEFNVPENWGICPALVLSTIYNHTKKYRDSVLSNIIEILDEYLKNSSVKSIYKYLHGYPIYWQYADVINKTPCRHCNSTGYTTQPFQYNDPVNGNDRFGVYGDSTCGKCDGKGFTYKKDVSDGLMLQPPTSSDDPTIAPNVAGYIQPDLATWNQMTEELKLLFNMAFFSMWGTTLEQGANNETATAKLIDAQPVADRLNYLSQNFENIEEDCIWFIGKFYFGDSFKSVTVNYGRRYLMETPDVIYQKYQDARTNGSPVITLDLLLDQYYQAEFMEDPESLAINRKAMRIEPFIHQTNEEVEKLSLSQEEKQKKFYFNEWFRSQDRTDLLVKTEDVLRDEYNSYFSDNFKTDLDITVKKESV